MSPRSRAGVDALVLGVFKGEKPDKATRERDPGYALGDVVGRPEATGDAGVLCEAFPNDDIGAKRIILVGLGDKEGFGPDRMLTIAAGVGRRLAAIKATSVEFDFAGPFEASGAHHARCAGAIGESLALLSWDRSQFKGSATNAPKREKLAVRFSSEDCREGFEHGLLLGASANFARTMSETPANICHCGFVVSEAKKMARQTGMKCTVIRGKDLEKHGLTGIATVGAASEHEPALVRLEYTPERPKRGAKPAVLVGKTIVYDTGGLSLKISGSMRGMKRDMDGGAAVMGAMHAIATAVKPRRPVVALLCVAENSVSDEACRPDDIIRYRNGVTVEITNTDAEGRLVMADGLIWACEEEDPAFVIDMATLTGGVVVALGNTYAGMWCDDDDLRGRIEEASERSGERVWRMPLHQEYRDMMKSNCADIWNSAPVRAAHPIQGAAFLSYFVDKGVPWAHIDIAGVHSVDGDKGPYVKDSCTGFGVRLAAALMDQD
ncbi:MAG: leucyl aminopeptidase family protein [Planctomycetota bacterium]